MRGDGRVTFLDFIIIPQCISDHHIVHFKCIQLTFVNYLNEVEDIKNEIATLVPATPYPIMLHFSQSIDANIRWHNVCNILYNCTDLS